ncbi:MAG: L,D-transpeptidase family protein [Parcubacteria group bacterium]
MKKLLLSVLAVAASGFLISTAKAEETHAPQVKVFNAETNYMDVDFQAFEESFQGGTRIAAGDFDGDGYGEIAVGAGVGGGPHVRIFDHQGNSTGWNAFVFHQDHKGGVDVATGDIDGDGIDELIVGQYMFGQAKVKVYRVDSEKTVLKEFLAFDEKFKGGVRVAAGDIDGDGIDEIITGTGGGGGPQVKAFEMDGREIMNFTAFHPDHRGGVDVAAGDVNADGRDEVVVAQNSFGQARVKTYQADTGQVLGEFLAYANDFQGGANVAVADIDNDYEDEIITGTGQRGGPQVRAFEFWGKDLGVNFKAYAESFRGGIDVTAHDIDRGATKEIITSPGRIVGELATYDYYKYIEVDLSEQTLKYFEGGMKIDEHLISSGLVGPTPQGTFKITRKRRSVTMTGPGYHLPGVPYVLSFLGPYTIHGTYWHSNFGHPMSHGCVNMYTPDAAILYEWAEVGDVVVVHG